MSKFDQIRNRRRFLQSLTIAGAAAFTTRGLFAQQLVETARAGEGPYYPDKLPLDTDNDLIILNDATTPAVGAITHLTGRLLSPSGQPIRNAFIEIWQVDNTGSYVHTLGRQSTGYDKNFQGYGRFLTDAQGRYYFRTIRPIPYTLQGTYRTAHTHVAVSRGGKRVFTTQMLVDGEPGNAKDGLLRNLKPAELKTLLVPFKPMAGSTIGELTAAFDIVLGKTAAEDDAGQLRGVGQPLSRRPA
jgi:protocatechuate 3,4-dioxygenase, beta subunit